MNNTTLSTKDGTCLCKTKELMTIKNSEYGEIRTVTVDGEPWFVATDICRALDLSNPTMAMERLDEDEKSKLNLGLSGGATNCVNEYGLYNLILASRKPSAKDFKRWITHEVIPSIRQNGGYIANQENLTPEQIVANALIVAQNIILQKDKQIEELKPKADYFDELVDRKLLTSFRETAKELGIKEGMFISWLIGKNYIYRDAKNKLQPYSTAMDKGLFEVKEYSSRYSNHAGTQTLITPKGRETFRLLLNA